MGFLGSLLKKAVSSINDSITDSVNDGIRTGVNNAVESAVESAVRPAAENLANEAASGINQAAEAISEDAEAAKENRSELAQALENLAKAAEQYNQSVGGSAESHPEYYAEDESDSRSAAQKIEAVLAESFPQYEVKKNVSPTTVGGTGRFLNYSYGIYAAGAPKLFIMLVGKTTCGSRMYRWSKEAAQKAGVTLINFIEHYPNRPEYIKERLQKYL